MADLKVIFLIMLMINIGTAIIFKSGAIEDIVLQNVGNRSGENLNQLITTSGDFGSPSGSVDFTSEGKNISNIAKPITEDSQSATTIFRTDNPFAMILNLMLIILGTLVFGLIYILSSAQAPLFVVMLIGVPFTLIYWISAVIFIRSGN